MPAVSPSQSSSAPSSLAWHLYSGDSRLFASALTGAPVSRLINANVAPVSPIARAQTDLVFTIQTTKTIPLGGCMIINCPAAAALPAPGPGVFSFPSALGGGGGTTCVVQDQSADP